MLLVDYNLRLDTERFRTIADDEQSISSEIEVAPAQPADFRWLQRLAEQQHDYSLVANGSASFAASDN